MGLRTKALLGVVLTMAALYALLFGGAYAVLTARYRDLETSQAASAARRATDALEMEVERLGEASLYLATRDDVRQAMQTGDGESLRDCVTADFLIRQEASFVIMLDESGSPRCAAVTGLDANASETVDPAVVDAVARAQELRPTEDSVGHVRGFMTLPDGPIMVAAHPITTGERRSTVVGTLVLGRYVDAAKVELERLTGLALTVVDPPKDIPRAAVTTMAAERDETITTWWNANDMSTLHSYSLRRDLDGDTAFALRAEVPRDVRAGLQSAIVFAGVSLFLLCVVATWAMYLIVDWVVLAPLAELNGEVRDIGRSGDSTLRVTKTSDDELGSLADGVNAMLLSIQAGEHEIRRSHEELERRVERRTRELFLSDARHRELIERMADAVFSVALDGRIELVNKQALELTMRTREELVGALFTDLLGEGSDERVKRHLGEIADGEGIWTVDAYIEAKSGTNVPVELRAAVARDMDGQAVGTQWIARDITDRLRYEEQLIHLATHDPLTGLANRRSFESALEMELAESMRGGVPGAVLWLDLDDFKDINDTMGHAAGDEMLVMAASILSNNIRSSNLLARVGGDEFAILIPRVDRQEAITAADRLLTALTAFTYLLDGRSVRVGASVGVVFFPENGSTVQEVVSNADAAMYMAKEAGRSRVWVTASDEHAEQLHVSRMTWNERLTAALENDGFVMHAQPILDLYTGETVRHELLIRMRGEGEELYAPSSFLPVAERLGLIKEIDRWVLKQAIRVLKDPANGITAVEVNLSGKEFSDHEFVSFVGNELARSGVDPRLLGFEITETAAIADMASAQMFIRALKDLGCRFSLDDFGSGFSSFNYLKHLPVDCLKIDGSYIRGLAVSEEDRCLVRGICEMCRGLGVRVLGECVEDAAVLAALRELGLDYAQGYHIGVPCAVEPLSPTR